MFKIVVKTPDHLVHFSGYGDLTHNINRKILVGLAHQSLKRMEGQRTSKRRCLGCRRAVPEVAVDGARDLLRLSAGGRRPFLATTEITSSVDERI